MELHSTRAMISQSHIEGFYGDPLHSLDVKNRLTIPVTWRSEGEEEIFFTVPHPQKGKCLLVMPPDVFKGKLHEARRRSEITPQDQTTFVRQFYSRANRCATDKQGRIIIPEKQKEAVGLNGEVRLVGVGEHFEIWPPERWEEVVNAESPTFENVSQLMGI